MIFENDVLTFQLLDVLRLQNTCEAQVHRENRGRHFCALSFRVDTDARLTGGGVDVQLRPGAVAFLPANVDYQRRATHDELNVIHFDILNFSAGRSTVSTRTTRKIFAAASRKFTRSGSAMRRGHVTGPPGFSMNFSLACTRISAVTGKKKTRWCKTPCSWWRSAIPTPG